MPFYSEELVDEVRRKSDIVDVISSYVQLKKKGSTYFGLCPFHNEKTGSFSVTPGKEMFYCFGCHAGGNVFTFVQKIENISYPEAIRMLAQRANVDLPVQDYNPAQKAMDDKRERMREMYKEAAQFYVRIIRSPEGERAARYFTGRELTPEIITRFGLGSCPTKSNGLYTFLRSKGYSDREIVDAGLCRIHETRGAYDYFFNRAMFPIMDDRSRVIGFGGRVMGEGEPKYLNTQETLIFDKSRVLYGMNIAKTSKREGTIICEGYMDVISLHKSGFDNAVACMGTAFPPGQLNLLKRYNRSGKIFLSYDSDGAGVDAALRAIPILKRAGFNVKVINMRPHKDPDEFIKALGVEAYEERIRNAEDSFIYILRMHLEQTYDLSDPQSRFSFYRECADSIARLPDALERSVYIDTVSMTFDIPREQLETEVRNAAKLAAADAQRADSEMAKQPDDEAFEASLRKRMTKRTDPVLLSQGLLLNWLYESPEIWTKVKKYLTPEDFNEGVYQEVARLVMSSLDAGTTVDVGSILARYIEPEEAEVVAAIFSATAGEFADEKAKVGALKETVIRIMEASMKRGGGSMLKKKQLMIELNKRTDL